MLKGYLLQFCDHFLLLRSLQKILCLYELYVLKINLLSPIHSQKLLLLRVCTILLFIT